MSRRTAGGRGRSTSPGSGRGAGEDGRGIAQPLVVSGGDGVHVVHRRGESQAFLSDIVDALRDSSATQATVLVSTEIADEDLDELSERLAPILAEYRETGVGLVRLVMSAGAAERAGAPAPARRLCEDRGIDVLAPSGVAVVVPGGSLFAPNGPGTVGGWWHFSPGLVPKRLGARLPAPSWEGAMERVDPGVAENHLVQQVPAGLLVQPLGAPPEGVEAIRYAVPADPVRPVLLVGVPGSPPVSADALADVLAALPGQIRGAVRLVPGDGRDLLSDGQEVADALGLEVQVVNGLPVLLEQDSSRGGEARVLLVGPDGTPSWQPFVKAVTCLPAADGGHAPAPRLASWRAPAAGLEEGPEPGVLLLDKRWQVTLTRAGLWVGPRGGQPVAVSGRAVDTDVMAIDLGIPGRALDDTLWPVLERLFVTLEDEVRDRAMIQVHGNLSADGMKTLRRLAVRHGLALAPKGWRSGTTEQAEATVSSAPLASPTATAATAAPAAVAATTAPDETPAVPATPAPAPVPPAMLTLTTSGGPGPGSPTTQSAPPQEHPATGPRPAVPTTAVATHTASAHAGSTAAAGIQPPQPEPVAESAAAGPPHPSFVPPPPVMSSSPEPAVPAPAQPAPVEPQPREPEPLPEPPTPLLTTADSPDVGGGSETPEPTPEPEPEAEPTPVWKEPVPPPAVQPGPPAGTLREITFIPVQASHHSSAQEREALRTYLGTDWNRHAGAVQRALTRLPGLRTTEAQDDLSADLAAVHAHVNVEDSGLNEARLLAAVERRDPGTLAFLACLASGLRRLPSFRGAAVRAAGLFGEGVELLLPGEEVGESTAVSALALDKEYPSVSDDHYLIWSMTGRRAGALADNEGSHDPDEVFFGPGTRFRVLQIRKRAGADVVLLRELAQNTPVAVPGRLADSDLQILDRLNATADRTSTLGTGRAWPVRCTGPFGVLAPEMPRTD
ncbi:hypothetical protein ACIBBE_43885 [Streptomyces sp. NPDC051644]|uniref:hypothetical protein n=1 Tax=Streptomyces sp. NPDC051644 TaxID=3365666 RepID=UPI00379F3BE6